MDTKRRFFLVASVIFLVGLFACGEMVMAVDSSAKEIKRISSKNNFKVNGTEIEFSYNAEGCIDGCRFYNDPALCGGNAKCSKAAESAEAGFIDCLETAPPKIGGKPVKWAGNLSNFVDQTCDDFSILTYNSAGWLWQCSAGSCQLVCVGGFLYLDWCCDSSTCVQKP